MAARWQGGPWPGPLTACGAPGGGGAHAQTHLQFEAQNVTSAQLRESSEQEILTPLLGVSQHHFLAKLLENYLFFCILFSWFF